MPRLKEGYGLGRGMWAFPRALIPSPIDLARQGPSTPGDSPLRSRWTPAMTLAGPGVETHLTNMAWQCPKVSPPPHAGGRCINPHHPWPHRQRLCNQLRGRLFVNTISEFLPNPVGENPVQGMVRFELQGGVVQI